MSTGCENVCQRFITGLRTGSSLKCMLADIMVIVITVISAVIILLLYPIFGESLAMMLYFDDESLPIVFAIEFILLSSSFVVSLSYW